MKRFKWVILALAGAILGLVWFFGWGDKPPAVEFKNDTDRRVTSTGGVDITGNSSVGRKDSVERKDVASSEDETRQKYNELSENPENYGTTPLIPADANEQVAMVVKASREGTHPERRSALILPEPFDAEAYETDPDTYLNTPEPGRVFQPAQPGEDVVHIQRQSPFFQEVVQGESITLSVKAIAGAPVTFTSFDLGRFENLLTTVTVRANAEGVAQTQFFGVSGTINDVNILAASPVTSGQVKFIAHVNLPPTGVPVPGGSSE